ncbi:Uncharacterized protein OBRU01_02553 [Operophtera brumata]|uniref:CCHC-type domain-containing protein n=1 Tax=Operophtera brumata TaxID=104452 RepID=A0A0L7LFF9_OPEBR|nr:Uncharacterized protein OBRU01_02553 [Operophtera brumata]
MEGTPVPRQPCGDTDDGDNGATVAGPVHAGDEAFPGTSERALCGGNTYPPSELPVPNLGDQVDDHCSNQLESVPCYEEDDNRRNVTPPCHEEGDAPCYEEVDLSCYEEDNAPWYEEGGEQRRNNESHRGREIHVRRNHRRASSSSSEGSYTQRRRLRVRRRRTRSKSRTLEPRSKPFERVSRGRDRSVEHYRRHRTDYYCNQSPVRSTKRRSRSITRLHTRNSDRNNPVNANEEGFYMRRPKTYDRPRRNSSEEPEFTQRAHNRLRSRLLSPLRNKHVRRHTLARKGDRYSERHSDSDDGSKFSRKRRRTRFPRDCLRKRTRPNEYVQDDRDKIDSNIDSTMDKFLNILKQVKGTSTSKLSMTNVVPEFDPMNKDQTILTWLTKVEECAEIYGWDQKETIHFALPKLSGIAKSWYTGLDTVLYSWGEWKKKLIETFPYRDDYAELLTVMLAKKVRFGESLERYFYEKINLLNRCSIKGRKAVDCILNGIEDRAVRVGAQAVQFREPEDVLKYLKTVKVTNERRDKMRTERKPFSAAGTSNRRSFPPKKIICYNCNEQDHIAPKCPKPRTNCSICNAIGHLSDYCAIIKTNKNRNKTNTTKTETKEVSELLTTRQSNEKYVFNITVNGMELVCHVDLGSQCTLIRRSEAMRLNLNIDTRALPLMRGIGGHHVQPLGRCQADFVVQGIKENIEIFVVEDYVLKYPVLLGHSFTEKPNITITKTPSEVIFEKTDSHKLHLRNQNDVTLLPHELCVVTIESDTNYTGPIYVSGSMRGAENQEYFLFPGEYMVTNGTGRVVILNMSGQNITLQKGKLVTRAILVIPSLRVDMVSFDHNHPDDRIRYGSQMTEPQKSQLNNLLSNPSEILFGFKLKGRTENILSEVIDESIGKIEHNDLNDIRSEVGQRIREQQLKDKRAFDAKRKVGQSFEVGDLVSVKREVPSDGKSKKLAMKYQGPYRVIKALPNERYLVEDTPLTRKMGNRRYENVIAIDKLKPWLSFNRDFDSNSESDNSDMNE